MLSKNFTYNYNFSSCFYGCDVWILILREEHRSGVLGNRMLKRIFRFRRESGRIVKRIA
jgi:hypothetical protein